MDWRNVVLSIIALFASMLVGFMWCFWITWSTLAKRRKSALHVIRSLTNIHGVQQSELFTTRGTVIGYDSN